MRFHVVDRPRAKTWEEKRRFGWGPLLNTINKRITISDSKDLYNNPMRTAAISALFLIICPLCAFSAAVTHNSSQLIDVNRSALVIIDVQDDFLTKLPLSERRSLVDRITWYIRMGIYMGVPLIVTAENTPPNPSVTSEISAVLPKGQQIFDKMVWNLMGQEDIRAAVEGTQRDTFILMGLETDVCVAQSALGLQAAGYRVAVVEDCTASPIPHHEAGIRRMRDAGVTVITSKALYYELVRDIPTEKRVYDAVAAQYASCPFRGCATDQTF
jgi:nicotinamidase-related amidase